MVSAFRSTRSLCALTTYPKAFRCPGDRFPLPPILYYRFSTPTWGWSRRGRGAIRRAASKKVAFRVVRNEGGGV